MATAALTMVALVSACEKSEVEPPIEASSMVEMLRPKLASAVNDGAIGISPSMPITASVNDGVMGTALLLTPDQKLVSGNMSPDGKSWTNTEPLGYDREYTLILDAFGIGGHATQTYKFTTSAPENLTTPYITTGGGGVMGIGQTVAVAFDEVIPDRKAAQDAIKITTDPPVEGAFYWVNGSEVRWRPEHFWAPGTKINIDVNIYGKDLGNGLFGSEDAHDSFSIGDPVVLTADDNTLQVTVEKNGQVIRTMPVSMGGPRFATSNGVYMISDQHRTIIMDSATYGVPNTSADGYRTKVEFATRMSYSGIFLHSAPWAIGALGSYDQSHGCLNLSPDDAEWVFNNLKRGDIVIVKNTGGGTLGATEGLGDWNMSWEQWKAGNATD